MSTLPRPTIEYNPQQTSPLDSMRGLLQLKSLGQQQQLQQAELQKEQLANQQAEMQVRDQQIVRQAFVKNNGDLDATIMDAAKAGASPQTLQGLQQHALQVKNQTFELVNKQGEKAVRDADLVQGAYDTISKAPPEQRPAIYQQALQQLQSAQVDVSKMPPQYPGDQALPIIGAVIRGHAKQVEDASKQALAAKETAEAAKTTAETKFFTDQGLAPGVSPEMASYASYIKSGGDPQNYKASQAQKEANATLPAKVKLAGAEATARQSAAQGDPNVAGQMLANGQLTLTDLKSRGTTPQYITKAVTAAQKQNPNYNPADEIVAEHIAKSPSANQFFGSANSLITKGGTLDQLESLGKSIPQHDLPALNTIEDWQKLQSGKGPLAAYAATALGVADDYSKVMGGGTGSDTSRSQVLRIFGQAASPEQRAQAIQSTRAAVLSQRDSRIGKNQFLKRQYGEEVSNGGMVTMKAPNGQTKQVSADQVEHYKSLGATVAQ